MASNNDQDDELEEVDSIGRFANAIVVTVEGLGTNLVGCYGNALTPTPSFDRFASQSLVADQFWMDGLDPVEVLKSMWSGLHRRERMGLQGGENASKEKFAIPGLFVTDDPRVYEAALDYVDGEVQLVEIAYTVETRFSSLVSDALNQWIPKLEKYPWLWIHSRGLGGPWDAPYELRLAMCDEGDPQPPSDVEPPLRIVDSSTDPDEIFGWACGAGGQAIAMDEVWGLLTDAIQELGFEASAMVILAGVQGYPLGEHGTVGMPGGGGGLQGSEANSPDATMPNGAMPDGAMPHGAMPHGAMPHGAMPHGAMYAERLHCPLIIRPGDQLPLSIRFSQFVQPHHIAGLLEDWIEGSAWIDGEAAGEVGSDDRLSNLRPSKVLGSSDVACDGWTLSRMIHGSGVDRLKWLPFQRCAFAWAEYEAALMLPSWSARFSALEPNGLLEAAIELYAMPDDRWQQNEISARAPSIVDAMNSLLNAWMQTDVHSRDRLAELLWTVDEALLTPIR